MENFPPVIAGVVHDCLQFEPSDRPSANDIAERLVKLQFEECRRTRDENGNTAFHRVVQRDEYYLVENELSRDKPVMINVVNNQGDTPLMSAKGERARKALTSYRPVPFCNSEPSRIPEYFYNVDVFGSLLRLAKKGDVEGVTALRGVRLPASMSEKYEKVEGWKGETALHVAAQTGNAALLHALVNLSIFDVSKTNDDGHTALHVATVYGHTDVIASLMYYQKCKTNIAYVNETRKAPPQCFVNTQDTKGATALHLAARSGNASAVDALLSCSSIDVNIRDLNGQTFVFEYFTGASSDQSPQVAALESLMRRTDVDWNQTNFRGETILHKIAQKNLVQAARIVLQRADLNISTRERDDGFTPLHIATRELSAGVVEALLSRGDIDINEQDKYGNTPLYILAKSPALRGVKAVRERNSKRKLGSGIAKILSTHMRRVTAAHKSNPNFKLGSDMAKMFLTHKDIDVNKIHGDRMKTCLHEAVANNNKVVAQELLKHPNIDVSIRGGDYVERIPLHLAALCNFLDIGKLLVARGGINDLDMDHFTPLHYAALMGHVDFVKLLLSSSHVHINLRTKETGDTPLQFAIKVSRVGVVKLLTSRIEVDVNAKNNLGRAPLHVCAERNYVKCGKLLLLRKDVDASARNENHDTPLHRAAYYGSIEVAIMLLSRNDIHTNARGWHLRTPLHYAAQRNCIEIAVLLLARDSVDADARDQYQETPLHYAAICGSVEVMRLLLSRDDVDVGAQNDFGQTPLHLAATEYSFLPLRSSLEQGGLHALPWKDHAALVTGKREVTEVLLSIAGVDAGARDKHQQTPLHQAAFANNHDVAKLLLERDDVDVNACDADGMTPLAIAAAIVQTTFRPGAEISGEDVAKVILSTESVEVDARDKRQQTALHHAARTNNHKVAELLLARDNVDIEARDVDGKTALDLAEEADASECVDLLRNADEAAALNSRMSIEVVTDEAE